MGCSPQCPESQDMVSRCIWPSVSSFQLPENAESQRYLHTCVIGSVEALQVLMGYHQNQMTTQVIFFCRASAC